MDRAEIEDALMSADQEGDEAAIRKLQHLLQFGNAAPASSFIEKVRTVPEHTSVASAALTTLSLHPDLTAQQRAAVARLQHDLLSLNLHLAARHLPD